MKSWAKRRKHDYLKGIKTEKKINSETGKVNKLFKEYRRENVSKLKIIIFFSSNINQLKKIIISRGNPQKKNAGSEIIL